MSKKTKIIVVGACGRMGKNIVQTVVEDDVSLLAGAIEAKNNPLLDKDVGELSGVGSTEVFLVDDLRKVTIDAETVLIDFTIPQVTLTHALIAAELKIPMVIGTTGFDEQQMTDVKRVAEQIPMVLAPNMSTGVNLMLDLVRRAAKVLGEDYDIEIFEAHHRHKKDAPSGTANRLAQVLCEATNRSWPSDIVYQRHGMTLGREAHQIGMQVLRGGDIVGEHNVYYCGEGERIEIKHVATDRKTFAKGAVRAAKWVVGQKPGLYDMTDVLGLKS